MRYSVIAYSVVGLSGSIAAKVEALLHEYLTLNEGVSQVGDLRQRWVIAKLRANSAELRSGQHTSWQSVCEGCN